MSAHGYEGRRSYKAALEIMLKNAPSNVEEGTPMTFMGGSGVDAVWAEFRTKHGAWMRPSAEIYTAWFFRMKDGTYKYLGCDDEPPEGLEHCAVKGFVVADKPHTWEDPIAYEPATQGQQETDSRDESDAERMLETLRSGDDPGIDEDEEQAV